MINRPQLPRLPYKGNEEKKLTLHLFLQIVGKIRLKLTPRKNHWWYVTPYAGTTGITTGPISYNNGFDKFEITLNFINHRLEVQTSKGETESFKLSEELSVASFYTQLMDILQKLGISVTIIDHPYDLGIQKPFKKLDNIRQYSREYARHLWQILSWADTVFKEFSGRFYGKTCPVHIYWHSMDLAVTRFSGNKAPRMPDSSRLSDKDAYTHECISFGFWPGDKNIPEPAFYSYTYPSPPGLDKELLASSANWIDSNGSPMALLKYEHIRNAVNPDTELLAFLESAYQAGSKLAGWDQNKFLVPDLTEL